MQVRSARLSFASLSTLILAGAFAVGCSVSVEVKPPHRYNGSEQTKAANADFNLEEITITNQNGGLQVVGDSSVTKITALVKPFALAEEGTPQADADAALKEIYDSLTIDESSGKVTVNCGQARSAHGKVSTGNTGCELVVKVPTGKGGVKLSATNGNGDLTASGLTAADGGQVKSNNADGEGHRHRRRQGLEQQRRRRGEPRAHRGSTIDVSTENNDIDLCSRATSRRTSSRSRPARA
ncbi:MAG: hypothetical protein U0235_32340 [Polyangiaceae bacterium]